MYGSITEPSTGLGSMLKSQKGKVTKGSAIDEVLPTAAWGRTPLQNQELMSHQDELGNNGMESGRVDQVGRWWRLRAEIE